MDFRPVFMVIGVMLAALAAVMGVPAVFELAGGRPDWIVFAVSAMVTMFAGVAMFLTCNTGSAKFTVRQAFLMTALSWTALTAAAALPFKFADMNLSFTDALFEAMSGLTTTGSTVITGLDRAPPGILLWRALLQWVGGIGIIVMAIAVLPMLRVGGMQLFRMESSDRGEKALPRTAQIAAAIAVIYLGFTVVCAAAYWSAGMKGFDAVAHAMTTIATGGFSTADGSVGAFNSPAAETVAVFGMIAGALPFVLYLQALRGDWGAVARDSQVRWFMTLIAGLVGFAALWLWLDGGRDFISALRAAAFNIVSVITGTGYATEDYQNWGGFAMPVFFFIMFVGGCAGSTACGVKVFRFQVVHAAAVTQFRRLAQPSGVFIPYYNGRPVDQDVIVSVLSFFFVFGAAFAVLAFGLGALGLDFVTAVSSAATAMANVGPALGPVTGPQGNFQSLPDAAKWLLTAGMLLGRLELFTILVLFTRAFWRG